MRQFKNIETKVGFNMLMTKSKYFEGLNTLKY
jgi:hypothetical protein